MTQDEINMLCTRLDRIEDKLDEIPKCMYQKVPRDECREHRDSIWNRLDNISTKVWIGVGVILAVQIFVVPVVLWLITK